MTWLSKKNKNKTQGFNRFFLESYTIIPLCLCCTHCPRRTSFFQNHYKRSAQQKCVPKARENSTSWPWKSCRPKFLSPDLGPEKGTRGPEKQCRIEPLRSSTYLKQAKKRALFWTRTSQTQTQVLGTLTATPTLELSQKH